ASLEAGPRQRAQKLPFLAGATPGGKADVRRFQTDLVAPRQQPARGGRCPLAFPIERLSGEVAGDVKHVCGMLLPLSGGAQELSGRRALLPMAPPSVLTLGKLAKVDDFARSFDRAVARLVSVVSSAAFAGLASGARALRKDEHRSRAGKRARL